MANMDYVYDRLGDIPIAHLTRMYARRYFDRKKRSMDNVAFHLEPPNPQRGLTHEMSFFVTVHS